MTRRLLSAGEVVVDLVLTVPGLPRRGGDVLARTATTLAGGAFNVMAAASRQGVAVTYAGLLGTGPMADLAAAALAAAQIDVALPARTDRDTGTVVALVEPDGERTFVTTLGAEAGLTDEDLAAVAIRADDVVHISGYGLAYPANGRCLARWVRSLPGTVTVVLDPGPLVGQVPPAVLDPVLRRTDWLSCTDGEARVLADDGHDPRASAAVLRERVRCGVVVRRGRRGAVVAAYDDEPVIVPALTVDVVDLNGAGDAHVGSLIASLATDGDGFRPAAAVHRANGAAALAVTRRGPATAPTREQLDMFMASTGRGAPIG